MKWMILFVGLLIIGSVYAEVESVSSGVFRGSMRHIITISPADTLSNVAPGDYLSFRFADEKYVSKSDFEDLDVYIRRFDQQEQKLVFDTNTKKFLELNVGDEYALDVDYDGADDVVLSFDALDRRGVFTVRDVTAVPEEEVPENLFEEECTVVCFSNDDCLPSEQCLFPGTCDASCVVDERINPPSSDDQEDTPEPADEVVEDKGLFTRFIEWLARLI